MVQGVAIVSSKGAKTATGGREDDRVDQIGVGGGERYCYTAAQGEGHNGETARLVASPEDGG